MSSFTKFFSGAYSFGTSERTTFKQQKLMDFPGPGAYTPLTKIGQKSQPSFKFPGSSRNNNDKLQDPEHSPVPPVGQYNIEQTHQGPKYSFGQLIKDKKFDTYVGPCTYNIKSSYQKQNPSYSFGYKSDKSMFNEKIQEGPGPGSYYYYNPEQSQNQQDCKLQIPQKQESQLNKTEQAKRIKKIIAKMKQSPGPGDYFPKNAGSSLSYSQKFGISERNDQPRPDINLGPGVYNLDTSLTSTAKGFSLLQKLPSKPNTTLTNPGPGTYNPQQISTQQTCQFMSTRRQLIPDSLAYPGPGAYNINKKQTIQQRPTFGKSIRNSLLIAGQKTPGVGNYELRKKVEGKGVKFIGKKDYLEMPEAAQYPGPGKYFENTEIPMNSINLKYGFGQKLYNNTSKQQAPGPGQYKINRDLEGLGYSFGQKHFDGSLKNRPPGPGSYEIASTIAAMPNYLNSSKISFMNLSKSLGDETLELQNQILGNS